MEVYLVGGAVRDRLLGLPARERDWVVVGSSPQQLLDQGYKQVGKDFPVFLHPETGDEYALARKEKKVAPGYHGFEFEFGPDVSLEEDLSRRDLTINAMALSADGQLIDPFNGRDDISKQILRHVSAAFSEDPLRVVRVARFASRFSPLGFKVADETTELMRDIVAAGELAALRPERLWQELQRAMGEPAPQSFVATLRSCDALNALLPEVDRLFGVPQPEQWHPEVDTGIHLLMALAEAAKLSKDPRVRFAVLTHDLGKGVTDKENWPKHTGHEGKSVELIDQLASRLPIPKRYYEIAVMVAREHGLVHRAFELRPNTILKLLERTDGFRRPERFQAFLTACEADARGRKSLQSRPYPQRDLLQGALDGAKGVTVASSASERSGEEVAKQLRDDRLRAVKEAVKSFPAQDPP